MHIFLDKLVIMYSSVGAMWSSNPRKFLPHPGSGKLLSFSQVARQLLDDYAGQFFEYFFFLLI